MTIIAYAVTGIVLTAIFAIAAVAVWKYDDGEKTVQFIVQTLLPLWGTWFGPVLAFYFGKEKRTLLGVAKTVRYL
jgi:hypothetical protein